VIGLFSSLVIAYSYVMCDCSIRVTVILGVSQPQLLSHYFRSLQFKTSPKRRGRHLVSSVKMKLKDKITAIHQATFISTLPHPLQCTFRSPYTQSIVSAIVQNLWSSASILKLMLWHLDTLLKESVDRKK